MENLPLPKKVTKFSRLAGRFLSEIEMAKNQLSTADANLHEGKLLSSIMPVKYIEIPDYPPTDNKLNGKLD